MQCSVGISSVFLEKTFNADFPLGLSSLPVVIAQSARTPKSVVVTRIIQSESRSSQKEDSWKFASQSGGILS